MSVPPPDLVPSAAGTPRRLEPGRTCWRIEQAARASVIVDAEDYFIAARAAMLQARHRIMLIGWDFDARIRLGDPAADGGPARVGDFIYWLVKRTPGLEVRLLRWDVGALKTLLRGTTLLTVLKWMRHPRIHTRLDGTHPMGGSHHQKIVVIDDCFAFCGGIDMTGERLDTRHHRDEEPLRALSNGKSYKPWHDTTTALEGPVAAALGELSRERWERSGGGTLPPVEGRSDCWPEALPVQFTHAAVAISRAEPEMPDFPMVLEVERLYLDHIALAERFLYAESQYFASRRIAEAIAARLEEEDGPEIVIVNPVGAQGWLAPIAMDSARARLFEALKRRDRHDRLRIYHPFTDGGQPIYVHAKILIVDDLILRVGSSNMNNRSLRLDTECDVTIDAREAANGAHRAAIVAIRDGLLAEHLGVAAEVVAATIEAEGSLIRAIARLRSDGRSLRDYQVPELSSVGAWLADNEVLDPEGPAEMFEPLAKRGLFRRVRARAAAVRQRATGKLHR